MKKDQVKKSPDIEWKAPSRPFKKRDRSYYQTIAALVFLLVVILFFLQEFLVIGVMLAVVFVSYVLASIPPDEVIHRITSKGIWVDGMFFSFSELSQFWFEDRLENSILVAHAPQRRSKKVMLVVPRERKDEIKHEVQKYLAYRQEPLQTLVEKISSWVTRVIPFEDNK